MSNIKTNSASLEDENLHQSKSEQKREIQEITRLGKRLLELPEDKLKSYPLSDSCLKSILEGKKITSPIGLNRQIKFIGKMLRKEDIDAISQQLAILDQEKIVENKKFHQLEHWRDKLLDEGDKALAELVKEIPMIDRQHLRQLIRNAHSEEKKNKPPKSKRLIFQYLKSL